MAPPIVNLIRPARGWSAGGTFVQLDGNDFKMPAPPPRVAGVEVPVPAPTVEVLFDGIPATSVQMISTAILRCTTPKHHPDRTLDDGTTLSGTVDVTVRNLDADGVPIPGESVTVTQAYQFTRPVLGAKNVRGAWLRVIDAFLEHWRDLVCESVAFIPATDYDSETGDVRGYVKMAALPGIAVTRVGFPDSATFPDSGGDEIVADDQTILLRRQPVATDITFTLVLVSNNAGELINLSEVVAWVFNDSPTFQVQIDPNDPVHGVADFTFYLTSPLQISERVGNTNIVTTEVPGIILRVLSVDLPGAPEEGLPGVPKWIPHQGTKGLTRPAEKITPTFGRKG